MRDSHHKTNVNSSGGGSIGVDLTVLWFYGVRPWPVAPSPPPFLFPRNSRSWEEPESSPWRWWNAGRANRGRPACASFPCIPYCPSRPTALSLVPSLPLSLFHSSSLSRFVSLILFFSLLRSLTRIRRAHSSPLRARRFISFLSSLSSFSIHVYIWHIYTTNEDFVSFSSSFPARLFFFHFQIPLCVSRAGTREFAGLSSLLSPSPFPSVPRFPVSTFTHVCMYVRTRAHDRRHSLSETLPIYLFFADLYSRARSNPCTNTSLHLPRNQTVLPRPVLRLPSASRWTRFFNRAELRRGEESLVMAS